MVKAGGSGKPSKQGGRLRSDMRRKLPLPFMVSRGYTPEYPWLGQQHPEPDESAESAPQPDMARARKKPLLLLQNPGGFFKAVFCIVCVVVGLALILYAGSTIIRHSNNKAAGQQHATHAARLGRPQQWTPQHAAVVREYIPSEAAAPGAEHGDGEDVIGSLADGKDEHDGESSPIAALLSDPRHSDGEQDFYFEIDRDDDDDDDVSAGAADEPVVVIRLQVSNLAAAAEAVGAAEVAEAAEAAADTAKTEQVEDEPAQPASSSALEPLDQSPLATAASEEGVEEAETGVGTGVAGTLEATKRSLFMMRLANLLDAQRELEERVKITEALQNAYDHLHDVEAAEAEQAEAAPATSLEPQINSESADLTWDLAPLAEVSEEGAEQRESAKRMIFMMRLANVMGAQKDLADRAKITEVLQNAYKQLEEVEAEREDDAAVETGAEGAAATQGSSLQPSQDDGPTSFSLLAHRDEHQEPAVQQDAQPLAEQQQEKQDDSLDEGAAAQRILFFFLHPQRQDQAADQDAADQEAEVVAPAQPEKSIQAASQLAALAHEEADQPAALPLTWEQLNEDDKQDALVPKLAARGLAVDDHPATSPAGSKPTTPAVAQTVTSMPTAASPQGQQAGWKTTRTPGQAPGHDRDIVHQDDRDDVSRDVAAAADGGNFDDVHLDGVAPWGTVHDTDAVPAADDVSDDVHLDDVVVVPWEDKRDPQDGASAWEAAPRDQQHALVEQQQEQQQPLVPAYVGSEGQQRYAAMLKQRVPLLYHVLQLRRSQQQALQQEQRATAYLRLLDLHLLQHQQEAEAQRAQHQHEQDMLRLQDYAHQVHQPAPAPAPAQCVCHHQQPRQPYRAHAQAYPQCVCHHQHHQLLAQA